MTGTDNNFTPDSWAAHLANHRAMVERNVPILKRQTESAAEAAPRLKKQGK